MSRTQKMFKKPVEKVILPDKKNFDGYPAFSVSVYEQYTQMVLVNTVGNTYYMSGDELFTYSIALHEKMRDEDPSFMAKAIVYARNNGLMRMQPVVGLAYLSTAREKAHFHAAFDSVIKTPGDLLDLIAVIGAIRKGKGLGRTVKRAINNWLINNGRNQAGLSEYHAIKYGGGESGKKWTLKDVIKLVHPTPKNTMQSALFNYIVNGTVDPSLTQVNAIESLKVLASQKSEYSAEDFANRVNGLIDAGRLPYEIVTGIIKPDATIWEYLMKQMPIFALVRNLNTLDQAGVFSKKANIDYVVSKLTDEQTIRNSRMLPFRFSKAYEMYKGPVAISNALEKALDISLANAQLPIGTAAWYLDVSGSMQGEYLEIGSLLGMAGLKASPDSSFLCFGSELKYPRVNMERSVMSNMAECRKVFGGGTSTNLCLDHLLGRVSRTTERRYLFSGGGYDQNFPEALKTTVPTKVDTIVIITDEQQNSGSPVVGLFREYRRTVNKDAKLFIVDIAPYNHRMANQEEPGVTFIYGWNDSVLDVMRFSSQGAGCHVEQIRNMRLA